MHLDPEAANTPGMFAGGVAGLLTFLFAWRKWFKGWTNDGAAIDTVNLLRDEVRRLCDVNAQLAGEVKRLHEQNLMLQREIETLHRRFSGFSSRTRRTDEPA